MKNEEIDNFLDRNPVGQRLKAAEYALNLLLKEELPLLKKYIFNAKYVLDGMKNPNDSKNAESYIKIGFESTGLQVALFYQKELNTNEAILFSRSLAEVISVTYAALGLDMSSLIKVNHSTLNT